MMFQEEVGDAIERAFAEVPDAPFIDQLVHVFEVMLRQNLRDVGLARIFVKELAFVSGERHGIDLVMDGAVRQAERSHRAREGKRRGRARDRFGAARHTTCSPCISYF